MTQTHRRGRDRRRHGRPRPRQRLPQRVHRLRPRPAGAPPGRHRRRARAVRRRRRAALRLRAHRDRLARRRRRARHRRGQRRRRQQPAPRDRRGGCWPPASTCSARSRWRRASTDAQAMVDAAHAAPGPGQRGRLHLPPLPRDQRDPRAGATTAGSARYATSSATTGATTASTRSAPMSWRYQGGPGSGVLADIGSHLVDLAEFFCGDTTGVQGTTMATLITDRPKPLGVAVGHAGGVAAQRRARAGGERGRLHLHHQLRQRRGRHVLAVPGRATGTPTRCGSTCSARTAPRRST